MHARMKSVLDTPNRFGKSNAPSNMGSIEHRFTSNGKNAVKRRVSSMFRNPQLSFD